MISILVIFFPSFWEGKKKYNRTLSELHARDRYAVAEKKEQKLKEKDTPALPEELTKKQDRKRHLVI